MRNKDLDQLYHELRHYYHIRRWNKSGRVRRLLTDHMTKISCCIAVMQTEWRERQKK